jgi:hypothetical protein
MSEEQFQNQNFEFQQFFGIFIRDYSLLNSNLAFLRASLLPKEVRTELSDRLPWVSTDSAKLDSFSDSSPRDQNSKQANLPIIGGCGGVRSSRIASPQRLHGRRHWKEEQAHSAAAAAAAAAANPSILKPY